MARLKKLKKAICCTNCLHHVAKDLSIWGYKIESKCLLGNFDPATYYGDGDYYEQTTDHQMCDEFVLHLEKIPS